MLNLKVFPNVGLATLACTCMLMLGCPPQPADPPAEKQEVVDASTDADAISAPEPEPEPVTPDNPDSVKALEETGVVITKDDRGLAISADCKVAGLTNEQAALFEGLPNLVTLSFENAEITDDALEVLQHLPHLKTLSLRRCSNVTTEGLKKIPQYVPNLERALLLYTRTKNDGLEPIGKLKKLKVLDLRGCMEIGDAGLAHITELSNLVDLKLRSYVVTDAGMESIGKLTKLKYLAMEDCGVGSDGLAKLAGLKDLVVFNVMRTVVGDDGLANFKENQLRDLRLRETAVTGPGLDYLEASRDTLTYLDLSETLISNEGLTHITPFKKLQTLSLWNGSMDDDGLEALTGLSDLKVLDLQGCTNLTSFCTEKLLKLSNLTNLNLAETGFDDEGLVQLKALKNLKEVKVGRTGVTDEGIAELKKALPDCDVNRDF